MQPTVIHGIDIGRAHPGPTGMPVGKEEAGKE